MSKIRKNFVDSIDVARAIEYDSFIKEDIMIDKYSDGLYFSEINYLTYEEIVYLYNIEKKNENKAYLLEKMTEADNILSKYKICVDSNKYDELTLNEKNRIMILLGFKTVNEVFPDFFKKQEMGFELTNEETTQKNELNENLIVQKINNQKNLPFFTMYKYAYVYYSMNLFLKFIRDNKIDKQNVWEEEKIIFANIDELLKIMIRPTRGDINTLHTRYINEKNKIYKFMYYHMILDSSDDQKMVNKLYKEKALDKLNYKAISHFYITGGGTPFILNKTKKVDTIHQNVLDELLIRLKQNTVESEVTKESDSNDKIIKFQKR